MWKSGLHVSGIPVGRKIAIFLLQLFQYILDFVPVWLVSCMMDIHCPIAVKSGKRNPHAKLSIVYEFRQSWGRVILDELNFGSLGKFWLDSVTNKLQNPN